MARTGRWAAGRARLTAIWCLLVIVGAGASGCRVATSVRVVTDAHGRGAVSLTVNLDRVAVAEVGGQAALAAQLRVADLVAAGWTVAGPVPVSGGGTVITASHPFATWTQASALVANLAGSGPAAARPFRLTVSRRDTFWRTETALSGVVDLRCGLACFGDPALQRATGSPVGVDPRSLAAGAAIQPAEAFTFSLSAQLPGSLVHTDAPSRQGGVLTWQPRLGQVVVLAAQTRSWNAGRIRGAVVGASVLLVLVAIATVWWWRRRRRRRGGHRTNSSGLSPQQAVTPGS
jgi:hypothetical protein